jgi:hypothetical protein
LESCRQKSEKLSAGGLIIARLSVQGFKEQPSAWEAIGCSNGAALIYQNWVRTFPPNVA